MKNEIIRKLTSLTLLTILLTSSASFALTGSMPVAQAAHNANLFVSAESSLFKNTFGGPMVVEVVINDPAITDTDEAKGEPDVTINGKDVRMVQATDGLWYAYVADRTQAQLADTLSPSAGVGLDFGTFCSNNVIISGAGSAVDPVFTDTVGVFVDGVVPGAPGTCDSTGSTATVVNVVREPKGPNTQAPGGNVGQIDIDAGAWPFIQLYDFNPTGSVEIKYNKGGGTQTTTLTFDTLDTYSKITLDRSTYTTGAEVHTVLTDEALNIDPTDEDSWTFGTLPSAPQTHYNIFDENGASTGGSLTSPDISPNLTSLMFEDNGIVKLAGNTQSGGDSVIDLDANNDQTAPGFVDDTFALSAISTGDLVPGTQPVTFVEGGANTGILTNYDENDDANIDILPTAKRGTSAAIDYNKKSTSILVGFSFGTLAFATPNGEWSSGEEIAVTLVDPDANKNSRADEDLDLNIPNVALIPALSIGDPFTLGEINDGGLPDVDVSAIFTDGTTPITTDENVQAFSKRTLLTATASTGATDMVIELKTDMAELLRTINNPAGAFNGFNFLNIDVRSITLDTVDVSLLSATDGCPIINTGFAAGYTTVGGCAVAVTPLVTNVNEQSFTSIVTAAPFAIAPSNEIGLLVHFDVAAPITTGQTDPIVIDFFSFGLNGDGLKTNDRINNSIYRFELEESGDNTSTFIGTAEFTMLNQLNIFDLQTYQILRPIDDEVTFIVHEDLDDEDAPRVSYLDLGSDGTSVQISAQEDAGTHSGVVAFDKDAFKVGDTVTITLTDGDLNVDSDLIDIFVTVPPTGDPADDTVGKTGLLTYADGSSFGRLLDVTFDDNRWQTLPCAGLVSGDTGLDDAGFTLHETGTDTGVFTGDFAIPADYCPPTGPAESVTGLDLEVNYVDFRDASGEVIEVGDGAGIRANTGSVSFDRTVYPVPFGDIIAAGGDTGESSPNRHSIFPIHLTGIGAIDATDNIDSAGETIGNGIVTTHIRVNDPDFDVSASGEDKIKQKVTDVNDDDVADFGPVKISVSRGSSEVILAYAGGLAAAPGLVINDDSPQLTARELGPITEIAPNAGIFEIDFDILFTDGPSGTACPEPDAYVDTDGTGLTGIANRFSGTIVDDNGSPCILQGDILTVEYTDPTDSSGDPNTITDSATFDLRNGVLQSDKSVYIIGSDAILTLIEPDLDLDSDSAESWDLDLIEWDSDAATVTLGNQGAAATSFGARFDPEPSDFRETGDNTGIFQVVLEIPNELDGQRLDRGEEIQLEYTDWGPSGADFVGDEDEDINLTIYTSNFGATVELDQKVYTWTDKVFVTIVAPDHNFDSNLVDDIGNNKLDQITVATRGEKLKQYKLTETGTDTGIFTGEVILTGFRHDADGDPKTGDENGNDITVPKVGGNGPTDGFLPADDDDGLTVSFEFTEDETVVGSALIRWNIGETQFLEASYPATGQGVLRVVDPDMNLNPEAVDNFDVDVWSDSDAGGIDLTVTETNEATGIFEGIVHFTVTDESSGHRLRVAEGDTVTGEYEDNTLPSPYTTADELEIAATTFIGSIVPPLERAPASNPRIVDAFGNELDEVDVDQQVQITADLANGQDRDQTFAYLVQIQDADGVTTSLSWITGSLAPGQSLNPAQSWTPTSPGSYNVQIFVWESVDNPDALSPPVSTSVDVV